MLRRWAYPVGRGAREEASKAGAREAEAPDARNGHGQIDGDRSRGNKDRRSWGTRDKAAGVRGKSEEQWGKRDSRELAGGSQVGGGPELGAKPQVVAERLALVSASSEQQLLRTPRPHSCSGIGASVGHY